MIVDISTMKNIYYNRINTDKIKQINSLEPIDEFE